MTQEAPQPRATNADGPTRDYHAVALMWLTVSCAIILSSSVRIT